MLYIPPGRYFNADKIITITRWANSGDERGRKYQIILEGEIEHIYYEFDNDGVTNVSWTVIENYLETYKVRLPKK